MRFNQSLSPITTLLVSIGLAVSSTASAEEHFRQHDAHVHGVVEVNIAQDGQDLLMEIHAPGADVVGFEHAPQTAEQNAALKNAIKTLASPDSIWMLTSSAQCQLVDSQVTETLSAQKDSEHDHDDHGHGHDHDKHDHDDHDHDHDHDHDQHGAHGEFSAQYTYKCGDINQLIDVKTQWFTLFPTTERITVNAITDKGQKAGSLTSNAVTFRF